MYFIDVETKAATLSKQTPEIILHITNGTTVHAKVPAEIGNTKCHVSIDPGTSRSSMSDSCFLIFMLANLKHLYNISVRSVSGGNLYAMGIVKWTFHCMQEPTQSIYDCSWFSEVTKIEYNV